MNRAGGEGRTLSAPGSPAIDNALLAGLVEVRNATAAAHASYLRFAESGSQNLSNLMAFANQVMLPGNFDDLAADEPAIVGTPEDVPANQPAEVFLDTAGCFEFAVGSIGKALGPEFAAIDSHPTRVRLPDGPLMLVDRILRVQGAPRSLASGSVVTEHAVHDRRWYVEEGHIPTSICVEAGQADLFLSGYLGIDFVTRGLAVYRLLDAAVTFHRRLPRAGETIQYDIHIDHFFRQGDTHLFRFRFEGSVNGEPLLTMTNGCAGFFTAAELAAGRGLVQTELQRRPLPGKRPADWTELAPLAAVERYDEQQLNALRAGDLAGCFGAAFSGLFVRSPLTLPGGMLKLVDRVVELDPAGGRYGMGRIRAEMDIQPDDWFLTCHFVDDQVMPGTLMYECCLHTLRIFLLRLGWVGEEGRVHAEPVPGVASVLKCRGQVTAVTRTVTYEVSLKELGYGHEPYAIGDALMYADGKPIVEITNMTLRLTGATRAEMEKQWDRRERQQTSGAVAAARTPSSPLSPGFAGERVGVRGSSQLRAALPPSPCPLPPKAGGEGNDRAGGEGKDGAGGEGKDRAGGDTAGRDRKQAPLFDHDRITAFCIGNPSDAFGERYRIFDRERFIARLPGPPFQFLDRIVEIQHCEPWQLKAGGEIVAEYDIPNDAWYFARNRQPTMPYGVLLEIALQPCGWLAAYLGSALKSDTDLHFRNLGGTATQFISVGPQAGMLATRVKMTKVAASGGMIIQHFDFCVSQAGQRVYEGNTYFGFFSPESLDQQVGIREASPYQPTADEVSAGRSFPLADKAPFPDAMLRMVDMIDLCISEGGPHRLGYIRGSKRVNPADWFFKAHFYQDPVWPGSLGLEAFLQLLKVIAHDRWGSARPDGQTLALGIPHTWIYRGQVVPKNGMVAVEACITSRDDAARILRADGYLAVDGRPIYHMKDFTLQG